MKVYYFGKNRWYESQDYHEDEDDPIDWIKVHVDAMIKDFTKRKLFRELLDLYSYKHGLEGYFLLKAHANINSRNKEWYFSDGKRWHRIQNWINRLDGQGLALILISCNPKNNKIHSEKSIVIHANKSINIVDVARNRGMRIYVPGEGYLEDNHYRLKKAIEKLQ